MPCQGKAGAKDELAAQVTRLLWAWVITYGGEERKKEGEPGERGQGKGMRERIPKLGFGIMDTPG